MSSTVPLYLLLVSRSFGEESRRACDGLDEIDLFELPPNGFPQWISSAADLTEAKRQLDALPHPQVGGEYLVRDVWSGSVVAYKAPHLPVGMVVTSASEPKHRARSRTARPEDRHITGSCIRRQRATSRRRLAASTGQFLDGAITELDSI